jgi:uncharacterized tellurite resistance protein B-like protein
MTRNYQLGLLYLVHLLVSADGVVDEKEMAALQKIREHAKVSDTTFHEFELTVKEKKERDIYQSGIDMINQCSDKEKADVFVILYKLSEVDGRVHVKEVRLLLYSIKMAGIEFDDVVNLAKATPAFF